MVFDVKHGPLLQGVQSDGGVDYKQVGESEQHSRGVGCGGGETTPAPCMGKHLILKRWDVFLGCG